MFSLYKVNDFVNILAGLGKAIDIPQDQRLTQVEVSGKTKLPNNPGPENRQMVNQIRNELKTNWYNKWLVVKNE